MFHVASSTCSILEEVHVPGGDMYMLHVSIKKGRCSVRRRPFGMAYYPSLIQR